SNALATFFAQRGEKPFRGRQVSHWIHQRFATHISEMTDLARALRERVAEAAEIRAPVIVRDTTATDGTRKWLIDAGNGNVVQALRLMLDDNAYGLSRRRVTLSTSGLVPMIDRLRDECPVALAVSLHAANDALRDRLVPINRRHPIGELLAACRRYLEKAPRDFITFEYVM